MSKSTEVVILLDRSSSMNKIRESTVDSINNFITQVQEEPGEGNWTLIQFDDHDSARGAGEMFPHVVYERRSDREMRKLELNDFRPRGGTALVDAVCLTIETMKKVYLAQENRPGVLIVVITDGQENSSREYRTPQMRSLIAEVQSQYNWSFLYLGANQDAFAEAGKYGIVSNSYGGVSNRITYDHTGEGIERALLCAATNARGWKVEGNKTVEDMMGPSCPDDPSKSHLQNP